MLLAKEPDQGAAAMDLITITSQLKTQVNKNLEAAFNYLSNQAVKMEKSEIWKNS